MSKYYLWNDVPLDFEAQRLATEERMQSAFKQWFTSTGLSPDYRKVTYEAWNAAIAAAWPEAPTPEMLAAGESAFRSYCLRHEMGAIPVYEAMRAQALAKLRTP